MHDNKYIRFYSMHDIPSISIFTKKKKEIIVLDTMVACHQMFNRY